MDNVFIKKENLIAAFTDNNLIVLDDQDAICIDTWDARRVVEVTMNYLEANNVELLHTNWKVSLVPGLGQEATCTLTTTSNVIVIEERNLSVRVLTNVR